MFRVFRVLTAICRHLEQSYRCLDGCWWSWGRVCCTFAGFSPKPEMTENDPKPWKNPVFQVEQSYRCLDGCWCPLGQFRCTFAGFWCPAGLWTAKMIENNREITFFPRFSCSSRRFSPFGPKLHRVLVVMGPIVLHFWQILASGCGK